MRDLQLKKTLDGVERWFDEKGTAGKSFRDSLEAGGIIASDLTVVAGAINGLLNSGLTREALLVLIQAKAPKSRRGVPMSLVIIGDVVDAMAHLHEHLQPVEPKVAKHFAKKNVRTSSSDLDWKTL